MVLRNILASIGIGLLASTSPCVFPLYPGYLAYLSASGGKTETKKKNQYFLGFFVLLGVLLMMLILGAVISLLSLSIGRSLAVIVPIADGILIALGILLLFDRNPFKQLPQIKIPLLSHPYTNAFLYGLLYGPIALPCSGPLVVSIFAISLQSTAFLARLGTFLWFGLGFGLPLFILSFMGGTLQKPITRFFARYSRWVNLLSGLLIVGLGVYDLWINWDFIIAGLSY
jgi:cytochrome c-type biogenesis protein